MSQLIESQKAHAGVIGFRTQHTVELDGMADRFVDLQSQLRAVENQIELTLGTLLGGVQGDSFFGDSRSMSQQVQLVYEFVALELILSTKRIRIRPLLNLAVLIAKSREPGAAGRARLVDHAPESRREHLPFAHEMHQP